MDRLYFVIIAAIVESCEEWVAVEIIVVLLYYSVLLPGPQLCVWILLNALPLLFLKRDSDKNAVSSDWGIKGIY
jgi:hypothetical protein